MRITHYLYNAFLLEEGRTKIAIDPGLNLALFRFGSLIPKSEWRDVTHILITHGDPDHHWQSDRVAKASGAHVVCGRGLARFEDGRTLLVAPRGRGLSSWVPFEKAHPLGTGEAVTLDGVTIEAVRAVHGPIAVPFPGFMLKAKPGPGERVGLGSTGFRITLGGRTVVNVGDSLLQQEWHGLNPDVLMLPIGGRGNNVWTMDVTEAVEAVRIVSPRTVIPCHYNIPLLWIKTVAAADDRRFEREVEKLGVECRIMGYADEIVV